MAVLRFFLFVSLAGSFAFAEPCEDWFKKLKISPGSADCEMKCAMGDADMGSFDCPSRCDRFCSPKAVKKPDCKLNSFWTARLNGSPYPFKSIVDEELTLVTFALSRLPKDFQPTLLKAMVKGTRPHFTAPSSDAASSDEFIILFPRAFSEPAKLDRIITHEAVHVLILKEWASVFEKYKKISGWSGVGENGYRKGDFVEPDGKMSPEEDFANNIEYYLFDRAILNEKSPDISSWLQKNLGSKLRLEKGCPHGK